MSDIVDKVLWGLNQAAFGDVRNVFKEFDFNLFMGKPIGLLANSYDYMANTLRKNIGNSIHSYDGYGTPIGVVSNPFYNSFTQVPWFFMDGYKNSSPNYIEYIKRTYGATISVENINNSHDIRIIGDGSKVGVIQTSVIKDVIRDGDIQPNVSLINPNGLYSDTKLGLDGTYYAGKTLNNALAANDERHRAGIIYGVTRDLKKYFGLSTQAVLDNDVLNVSSHNQGESFLSTGYYNNNTVSPVYNSNYGNIDNIGIYKNYIETLSEDTLYHFHYNSQLDTQAFYKYDEKNGKKIYKEGRISAEDAHIYDETEMRIFQHGRKYLPTEKENYLSSVGVNFALESQDYFLYGIRYIFEKNSMTIANASQGGVYAYAEKEGDSSAPNVSGSFNSGIKFGNYVSYGEGLDTNDLLEQTNHSFKKGDYQTLIARFKTGTKGVDLDSTIQTAISEKHGLSHGRNLLKVTESKSEGYDNPYCRVWTYHHQYHSLADAIRPFQESDEKGTRMITQKELYEKYGFKEFSADHSSKGFEDGRTRLGRYGTINQHNGLVNITPIDSGDPNKKVDIKNCMFSIENLAWKDSFSSLDKERNTFQNGGLSSEQKGPFGGRIMWFPPYDLKFNETVNVDWQPNSFIGRGENIYTYKNTTRSGQLSFKLLIDHPSIINYWENRGRSASNSVDDVKDPEQELLRFFAGCDLLSSRKAVTKKSRVVAKDDIKPSPKTEVYTFFVFYPNDYSGVDNNDNDFAVDYLTNGFGTWKTKTWNVRSRVFYDKQSAEDYVNRTPGLSKKDIKVKDNVDYYPSYASIKKFDSDIIGGYEMHPGKKGISFVSTQDENNDWLIKSGVTYNGQDPVNIYAQIGPFNTHKWDSKWYYRVDNEWCKNDKLKNRKSYIDKESKCLNATQGKEDIIKNFSITDPDKLVSFADVFVALKGSENRVVATVLGDAFNTDAVSTMTNIFFNKKDKIKEIRCIGQASIQGNSNPNSTNVKRNKKLAKNRAVTIQKFLSRYLKGVKISTSTISPEGEKIKDDVSDILNKLHRSVRVEIHVNVEESKIIQKEVQDLYVKNDRNEIHPTNPYYPKGTGISSNPDYIDGSGNIYYDESEMKSRQNYAKLSTFAKSVDYLTFNLKNSYDDGTLNINGVFNAVENFADINRAAKDMSLDFPGSDRLNSLTESIGGKDSDVTSHNMDVIAKGDLNGDIGSPLDKNPLNFNDDTVNGSIVGNQKTTKIKRYDTESKFFEMLELEEPFLHQKISDKVKYFDPAFHSISPEGFNARLTFLQQCSRQGPTCGSSDAYTNNNTANNLSFGRPPVCILRVGDFYYTKIIIESITVDFDPLMWDLNAEGIGVMPMIANINMSFKFIGGSSLSGPISRLQNALSFNAYANTEVYDNRAELAEYDDNGNLVKFAPYNPSK